MIIHRVFVIFYFSWLLLAIVLRQLPGFIVALSVFMVPFGLSFLALGFGIGQ